MQNATGEEVDEIQIWRDAHSEPESDALYVSIKNFDMKFMSMHVPFLRTVLPIRRCASLFGFRIIHFCIYVVAMGVLVYQVSFQLCGTIPSSGNEMLFYSLMFLGEDVGIAKDYVHYIR